MRGYLPASILIIFLSCSVLSGQSRQEDISARLESLFAGLRMNLPSDIKTAKNDSVRSIISAFASSDSVFRHRFSNLRFLGQISSPDNLVKILTWNLILPDEVSRYYCYLIHRDSKQSSGRVYSLTGEYSARPARTDTLYSSDGWYGALYYDVRPFTVGGKVRYVLLGIDYGNSFISRKVIDVLTFGPADELIFGYNCFTDGKTIVPRVIFEYASGAVMSLKFETGEKIVFDHLSPFSPEYKGNRQYYGPDFSFDSYIFENDLWRLKTDVDIKNK